MLDHLGKVFDFVAVVFGLASGGYAGLRRSIVKDLRDEVADKDRRLTDEKQLRVDAETKIAKLQTDYAALSKVVTGETYWAAVGDDIEEAKTELSKRIDRLHEAIRRDFKDLRDLIRQDKEDS